VPKWSVLLLESGGDESAVTDVPLMAPALMRMSSYNWGYTAMPQDNACLGYENSVCPWERGKGMGGTSIINFLVYVRGHRLDYDYWESLGNIGWGWNNVLRYFLKSENAAYDQELESSPFHSTGGYLDVQKVPFKTPVARTFLQSAVDAGYQLTDYNSGEMIGFSRVQATMRNGTRCSASKAFLRPIRHRMNLHIAKNAQVTKILINQENKRAYGVEFYRDGRRWFVKARKEVILSAGVINSPQLLMLSGIGPRSHLETLGIPVLQDLPGVGSNLQDHVTVAVPFIVNASVTVKADKLMTDIGATMEYLMEGRGPYTLAGGAEAIGFLRTRIARTPRSYPDIELVLAPGNLGASDPDLTSYLTGISKRTFNAVYGPLNKLDAFAICPIIMQPASRGWVRLRDRNPLSKPLMFANYFADDHDLETMTEGIKEAIGIGTSNAFRWLDSRVSETSVPGCEEHNFGSNAYWRCFVQHLTQSLGHQCCTAKMGPKNDSMSVVDPELRVHGIVNLRVVDASIMPRLVAGHTNAPVFMIGEKAADIIKKTYGK
jgi:choline dehydrogenase-like flavoprotein